MVWGLTCSDTMKLAAVDSATVSERSAQLPSDEKDEQDDADTWYDIACTHVRLAFIYICSCISLGNCALLSSTVLASTAASFMVSLQVKPHTIPP